MLKRMVSRIMLTLVFIGMLTFAFNIQPVEAIGTIYIRADGSVDPDTAPISTIDNITYTFTDNINDRIVVERNNIVIDGAGFTFQGTGSGVGIHLDCKSNVTIQNTHITDFAYGVVIESSSNNTLSGNIITNSQWDGVFIFGSSYNNTLYGNNITNNDYGVTISSSFNIVSGNSITNNWIGVRLFMSSNNTFSGNVINDNTYNFYIDGDELSHFMHSIDVSNLVDGKPIYYLVNQNDLVITPATYPEIGYLALINSINITVEDLTLKNNGQGLLLANTNNSRVTDNNIRNNYDDVFLVSSFNNTFSGNNITNSRFFGVLLIYFSNNTFHHNNFIDNYWNVGLFLGSANFWDDGYPSGGNYWSDHVCTGNPSDGSQPYIMDQNNRDHYPFQDPNGWLLPQLTQLTVTSSPVTGITFTINGAPKTTPYTEWLLEGSYTLEMREAHNGYVWSHWLEDGDPNRTKTVTLPGTTWTGVFVFAVQPHSPEAEFETTPDTALTGESIKFDASASLPGWNGTHTMPIVEYRWNFDDGNQTTTSTPIVYHSFSNSGIYYVTLTVCALGATPETDSVTHKVTITAIPVGGYSIPIKGYTTKPLTLYLALVAILTASFTIAKRRKKQQN